jgi:hypothetical protein
MKIEFKFKIRQQKGAKLQLEDGTIHVQVDNYGKKYLTFDQRDRSDRKWPKNRPSLFFISDLEKLFEWLQKKV